MGDPVLFHMMTITQAARYVRGIAESCTDEIEKKSMDRLARWLEALDTLKKCIVEA